MNKVIRIFLLFCSGFIIWTSAVKAQVSPPDFLCVSNDTLFWELPENNCGPFISYEIYGSQDFNGPYNLLESVSDQGQSAYYHQDAGGGSWYYYLVSSFDCPGQTATSSDTLDNLIPELGQVNFVSVENGNIEINWNASTESDVFAYLVLRNTNVGTVVLDTVFNGLSYTDTDVRTDSLSETYFVVALDRCHNASLVGQPHSSILLGISAIDSCERSAILNWTPYRTWSGGIEKYEIFLSISGMDYEQVASFGSSAPNYTFEDINDSSASYCFFVRAVESGGNNVSNSNIVCFTPHIVNPVRELVLLNASVNPASEVDLQWLWNPDAAMESYSLWRSDSPLIDESAPGTPLNLDNHYQDLTANTTTGSFEYQVTTYDQCGRENNSNMLATIFLEVGSSGTANELSWTPATIASNATLNTYELFKVSNGTEVNVASLNAAETTFSDPVDISDPDDRDACYYVLADISYELQDGSIRTVSQRSNTICISAEAQVFVPNAFAPDGRNRIFKPVMQFGSPSAYSMIIFDRWGGKVFESHALEDGWNGRKDGRGLPQDVYNYIIKLEQSNGKTITKAGSVFLLR